MYFNDLRDLLVGAKIRHLMRQGRIPDFEGVFLKLVKFSSNSLII